MSDIMAIGRTLNPEYRGRKAEGMRPKKTWTAAGLQDAQGPL